MHIPPNNESMSGKLLRQSQPLVLPVSIIITSITLTGQGESEAHRVRLGLVVWQTVQRGGLQICKIFAESLRQQTEIFRQKMRLIVSHQSHQSLDKLCLSLYVSSTVARILSRPTRLSQPTNNLNEDVACHIVPETNEKRLIIFL